MKIKASFGERVFQVFNYILLGLIGFVCLYPMWHVLMASFSDSTALTAHSGLLLWPIEFSLDAYKRVLSNQNIWTGYLNTIKYLVLGVSTSMVMTILGAYVLSRKDFMLRRPIMLAITFTMFFSGGTIPTYLNIQELGLKGSICYYYNSRNYLLFHILSCPSLLLCLCLKSFRTAVQAKKLLNSGNHQSNRRNHRQNSP